MTNAAGEATRSMAARLADVDRSLARIPSVVTEASSTAIEAMKVDDAIGNRPFKEEKAELVDEFERKYILKLLKRNDGNVSKSSREAGIERAYLQRLIKKYGIEN